MELSKFFRQVRKRWLLLMIVPLLSMGITYFFVKDSPASYTSQGIVATGLVDETRHIITSSEGGTNTAESQISQQFTNIIEMMKLKKMIDKVSFQLMIHDLSSPAPFKKYSKQLQQLSETEKRNAITFFQEKYRKEEEINLWNKAEERQYELMKSMSYDDKSISQSLTIFRKGMSDYIQVEYTSGNPELSPFVVNTLCSGFIRSYDSLVQQNKGKASGYLSDLLEKKYQAMNEKIALLRDYKIKNKILNLDEQSRILYSSMLDVDNRRMATRKDVDAYTGAISSINSKFDPKDRRYLESSLTRLNQDILSTKTNLYTLSDKYLSSGNDPAYARRIDSLTKTLSGQISSLNDQYIYDPLVTKKDLMGQKLSLEVQRDIAENSLKGLSNQMEDYTSRFNRLVPYEAVIQSYERDIDIASREYLDVLDKYNQMRINPDDPIRLTQVMVAMPAEGAPTKKIVIIAVAGIVSLVVCILVIFIAFFFDKSVLAPEELARKTELPVLGNLNLVKGKTVDLENVWRDTSDKNLVLQKELLRSVRYEVLQEMFGKKILSVTALRPDKGATFLSINLAYAFAMMHKKVLLIDGNFNDPSVSRILKPSVSVNDVLNNTYFNTADFLTVAGSSEETRSPFEIVNEQQIRQVFGTLPFDIIIIDSGALATDNKAKEWIACSDKVVGVYAFKDAFVSRDVPHIDWLRQTGKFAGWVFNKYQNDNV